MVVLCCAMKKHYVTSSVPVASERMKQTTSRLVVIRRGTSNNSVQTGPDQTMVVIRVMVVMAVTFEGHRSLAHTVSVQSVKTQMRGTE